MEFSEIQTGLRAGQLFCRSHWPSGVHIAHLPSRTVTRQVSAHSAGLLSQFRDGDMPAAVEVPEQVVLRNGRHAIPWLSQFEDEQAADWMEYLPA